MTKEQMLDRHFELRMDLAMATHEIVRLQKEIEKSCAELDQLDAEIDAVEAKEKGQVC